LEQNRCAKAFSIMGGTIGGALATECSNPAETSDLGAPRPGFAEEGAAMRSGRETFDVL
jgi:hypothetical protein